VIAIDFFERRRELLAVFRHAASSFVVNGGSQPASHT
jgi:hypothetical protein